MYTNSKDFYCITSHSRDATILVSSKSIQGVMFSAVRSPVFKCLGQVNSSGLSIVLDQL